MRYLFPILILLIAAGLRFNALAHNTRFHPDEALFATFARGAALNAEWWLPGSLDKPPLSIYAMAVSMQLFAAQQDENRLWDFDVHHGEFAARVPNTFASIVLVAVVYAMAKNLSNMEHHRGETCLAPTLLTVMLTALSPFAIAFSATAFTDGLMLLWMSLALLTIVRRRWMLSGFFLALSVASKQQGILYLPLVIGLGWARYGLSRRDIMRFLIPLMGGIALLIGWDMLRPGSSIFALAANNNNPERLFIRADEILPRLMTWLDYGRVIAGPTWLTIVLTIVGLGGIADYQAQPHHEENDKNFNAETQRHRVKILHFFFASLRLKKNTYTILLLYIIGFGLLYWLTPLNTYDRYLLPILPVIWVVMARGITDTIHNVGAQRAIPLQIVFTVIVFIFALPTAIHTSNGYTHVGGDLDEHSGIDDLAAYLNGKPLGAIIYDRWLGWELGYYLGEWTDKRVVYYPTPKILVDDALLQPDPAPRYFVALIDVPHDEWVQAMTTAGFVVTEAYRANRFVVYELIPPTALTDA
ncbi:MAG: hypothetical protein CUN54_05360 [Phototrophicales bacterium]|nr:MAG: hypothetical protein CUN54_05360 [Phototrophicales bacterium]